VSSGSELCEMIACMCSPSDNMSTTNVSALRAPSCATCSFAARKHAHDMLELEIRRDA
jgi:hypothetical protein